MNAKPVSEGYTSKIFMGTELDTQSIFALKRMRNISNAKEEAEYLQNCPAHPQLIQLHDFFISEPYGYIVMDYHAGQRLGYFRYGPKREPKTALEITIHVLSGLKALHESGLLHCDITPHNIMTLNDDPESVKIIDFGCIVRKNKNGVYQGTHNGGTDGYMPPELTRNAAHLDDSSDLYSAACVCLYLLIGEAPFSPKHACQLIEDQKLQAILTKATDSVPSNRYRTAQELIDVLTPLIVQGGNENNHA